MKPTFSFILFLIMFTTLAQEKIYVMPAYDRTNSVPQPTMQYVRDQLSISFANSNQYQAVDMPSIDALIDLQAFYEQGYISDKAKIELGKIPDCQYILKTELSTDMSNIAISVKLLYKESLIMVKGKLATVYINNDRESIIAACNKIINELFGTLNNGGSNRVSTSSCTDPDGKTYKTVKIGNQTWMAENLNYSTGNSWCYDNNTSNCSKYGRLYDWETAKKACPRGWHLPSKSEFEILLSKVGGEGSNAYHALKDGGSSGFSALFGGWRRLNGNFSYIGNYGDWWSSTENDTYIAWILYMHSSNQYAYMSNLNYKVTGFSVRCLQD